MRAAPARGCPQHGPQAHWGGHWGCLRWRVAWPRRQARRRACGCKSRFCGGKRVRVNVGGLSGCEGSSWWAEIARGRAWGIAGDVIVGAHRKKVLANGLQQCHKQADFNISKGRKSPT